MDFSLVIYIATGLIKLKICAIMSIHFINPETIHAAAKIIQNGGVVAFPTETVYGLGADAFNALAVAKIFEIKNRPHFDPLIVHIADDDEFEKLAFVNLTAKKLALAFWPGPLTMVLKKKSGIPDLVVSGLDTIAIRMPNHPAALSLIRAAKTPIAAPSANPFGYLSPTTAKHVSDQLGNKIDFILDGGPCLTGVESTIVDLSGEAPRLLRPGGISVEDIEKVIGPIQRVQSESSPIAPGQLKQHYSPRKPLRILSLEQMRSHPNLHHAGVLLFKLCSDLTAQSQASEFLSQTGDLKEAATNLFSALHRLDHSHAEIIFAEPVPEVGLGLAIMDRLRKAAATYE